MLLERHEPGQILQDALDRVRSGAGEIATVSGEAGIGKSVLLRAFAERAETSARVLWGACDDLRTPRPLGPLIDSRLPPDHLCSTRSARALREMWSSRRPSIPCAARPNRSSC